MRPPPVERYLLILIRVGELHAARPAPLPMRIAETRDPAATGLSLMPAASIGSGDSEAGFVTRTKTSSGAPSIVFIVFVLRDRRYRIEGLDSEHRGIIALTKEQVMHAARTVPVLPNG